MFGRSTAIEGCVLACPECGSEYTHQIAVVAGFREREDSTDNLVAVTSVSGTSVNKGHITGRRDAAHISFSCECCPAVSMLTIMQHKGMTTIYWEDASVPVEKKVVRK